VDRAKFLATSDEPIDSRSIRFVLSNEDDNDGAKETDSDDEQLKCFNLRDNTPDDETASGSVRFPPHD
jgi:hypothetical protein